MQPLRLGHLLIACPFGFDVDGPHDRLPRDQRKVVFRQAVLAYAPVIAEKEFVVVFILEPRIAPLRQIPHMVMRIEDREFILRDFAACVDMFHVVRIERKCTADRQPGAGAGCFFRCPHPELPDVDDKARMRA
jgi:hypothetical protein